MFLNTIVYKFISFAMVVSKIVQKNFLGKSHNILKCKHFNTCFTLLCRRVHRNKNCNRKPKAELLLKINIYSKNVMKSICNVEKICYTLKVDFFDLQIMETNTKNK